VQEQLFSKNVRIFEWKDVTGSEYDVSGDNEIEACCVKGFDDIAGKP
jgi:hypothetical protein